MTNPILSFYLDDPRLKETLGFTIADFVEADDDWLEKCHGHIQWAFPMEVPSMVLMQETPLVTPEVIEFFRSSGSWYGYMMERAFNRMWEFYELNMFPRIGTVERWITPNNHNFLRITRILRSTKMLVPEARLHEDLYDSLQEIITNPRYRAIIGEETINYWNAAHVETFESSANSST